MAASLFTDIPPLLPLPLLNPLATCQPASRSQARQTAARTTMPAPAGSERSLKSRRPAATSMFDEESTLNMDHSAVIGNWNSPAPMPLRRFAKERYVGVCESGGVVRWCVRIEWHGKKCEMDPDENDVYLTDGPLERLCNSQNNKNAMILSRSVKDR